jgi:hypothetical protein
MGDLPVVFLVILVVEIVPGLSIIRPLLTLNAHWRVITGKIVIIEKLTTFATSFHKVRLKVWTLQSS